MRHLTWQEFKPYFKTQLEFIHYTENDNEYELWCDIENKKIESIISKIDSNDTEAMEEFESNYKNYLNNKKSVSLAFSNMAGTRLYRKSYICDAVGGESTTFTTSFNYVVYLQGGEFIIKEGEISDGDYIEFSVVDVDNVLGYGSNFILDKMIETEYVINYNKLNNTVISKDNMGMKIYSGLHLCAKYVSTGVSPDNDVKIIVRYNMFRHPIIG